MTASLHPDAEVLIVGAGPTGLVLALWLGHLGVRVRIIDQTAEPGTTSRAVAVQARTLELYDQIGLADTVVERGLKVVGGNIWVAGKRVSHFAFGELGTGLSPFPYALVFPQDEHESLLIDRLAELGIAVERSTALSGFEEVAGRIVARLEGPERNSRVCEAAYIAGCDGAHSTVREALGIGFGGGTYAHLFYVADVHAGGIAMNREIQVALDSTDFLATFPLKGEGRARLVGTVRDSASRGDEALSWDDVGKRVIAQMQIEIDRVNWFSTYRVHHRVADRFRTGRAFLLGDAAHVHSPVGGQGMNTGIGDAVNLAWKLAAVLRARADASLLDSYEPERIAFARRLVATTDRAFTAVTSRDAVARWLRLDVAPLVVPLVLKSAALRRILFRTVSQTAVNYRESGMSVGRAGKIHGGDRLPWVQSDPSNFAPLTSLEWQVHVYGDASSEIRGLCDARRLALHVFPWGESASHAGLRRNATYLVRPDGYVALADALGRATALASYLDARALTTAVG